MIGELSQKQIAEQIEEEKSKLDEASSALNKVKRLPDALKKAAADVENEIKKLETGKLAKAYEKPEEAMLTKHLPSVLQNVVGLLRILKRNGVPLALEDIDDEGTEKATK